MFADRNCPYCHSNLNGTSVHLYCSREMKTIGTPLAFDKKLIKRLRKGNYKCKKCKIVIRNIKHAKCDKVLPSLAWRDDTFNIAIIGAKGSGKSHFMSVLLNQLRRETGSQFGLEVAFEDQEQRDYYNRNYWKPLYKDNQLLPRTKPHSQEKPAPFFIGIKSLKDKKFNSTLVYYDFAGEDLLNEEIINQYYDYLPRADGIFMLIDNIFSKDYDIEKRNDAIDMFEGIKRYFETRPPVIAIVMTKCDEYKDKVRMQGIENIVQNNEFRDILGINPEGIAGGHKNERDINERIRKNISLSRQLIDAAPVSLSELKSRIVNVSGRQEDTAFFTVSALNDAYDRENNELTAPPSNPIDIELPLKWMLDRLS
jgi:hypothetical protein